MQNKFLTNHNCTFMAYEKNAFNSEGNKVTVSYQKTNFWTFIQPNFLSIVILFT